MKAYRFLQDFKVGVGAPISSGFAGGFLYANYETIFKKGDVAQGQINAGPVQPINGGILWNQTIDFVKNGVKYAVPATHVTNIPAADVKTEAEKQKQWILIIAALVVAYFLFKK